MAGCLRRNVSTAARVDAVLVIPLWSYPQNIVSRLFNWTYRDVTDFLKERDFTFFEPLKGSHEAWLKLTENGEPDRIVELTFTRGVYTPRVLKKMIRQSGILEEEWIRWIGS